MQVWNVLHVARWKYRMQNDAKKSPFGHHPTICRAISSQLKHVLTIGKKLVKQQCLLHMSPQYGELRPTSGWDRFGSLGHPSYFQRLPRLGSVTTRHVVVRVSQTLRRWTESTTCVWQGDHHVGHWPTFLVVNALVMVRHTMHTSYVRSIWTVERIVKCLICYCVKNLSYMHSV